MPMKRYVLISLAFHAFLVLAMTMGFLNWNRKEVDLYMPIPVEVVDYADKAQSPDPTPDSLKLEEPEKEIEQEKPTPPVEPPKEEKVEEKPVPEVKPEPEVEKPAEPEAEVLPEPKKEEKLKEEKPKEKSKPKEEKPKEKPKDKPKEKKKKEPDDIMSIMKNLQSEQKAKGNSKSGPITATAGHGGELGDKLVASELDRVRKQIEGAWKIPAGSNGVHKLKVPIEIVVNPDRTVQSARIVENNKMGDVAYRTLAETALRAVLTFKNRPLLLPPEKYQVWKEITISFSPENVL